ncbi:hypothetical protein B0H10DRAFT_2209295 [Mycena sp. CBHHK59/15]|nr:hypothetical protein B0H10DRAFT_2209295 [Mycena sp. CBHHK59/15]
MGGDMDEDREDRWGEDKGICGDGAPEGTVGDTSGECMGLFVPTSELERERVMRRPVFSSKLRLSRDSLCIILSLDALLNSTFSPSISLSALLSASSSLASLNSSRSSLSSVFVFFSSSASGLSFLSSPSTSVHRIRSLATISFASSNSAWLRHLDAEAKVAGLGEVAATELILFDFKVTDGDVLASRALLVTVDIECPHSVAGF